jgi:adenylate/nucleoside-diphosphate kinase
MKYPTLSCKETVLKFIAISLKANNPNKDANYRLKYQNKLNEFLKHCQYPQEIKELAKKKMIFYNVMKSEDPNQAKVEWNDWDSENLLKLNEQFNEFLTELTSTDKQKYFSKFIR